MHGRKMLMGFQLDAAILPARQASLNTDKAEGANRSQSQEPSDFHKILGKENHRSQGVSAKSHSHDKTPDKDSSSVQSKKQGPDGHEPSRQDEGVDNDESSIVDNKRLNNEEQTPEEDVVGIPIDANMLSTLDGTTNETNTLDFVFTRLGFLSNEFVLHNKEQQNTINPLGLNEGVEGQEKLLPVIANEDLIDGVSDLDSINDIAAQMGAEIKNPVLANGITLASVVDSNAKNKASAMGAQKLMDEGVLGEKTANKSLLDESKHTHSTISSNDKNGSLFDTLLSEKTNTNNRVLASTENALAGAAQESLIADQKAADDTAKTTFVSKLGLSDIAMSPVNGRAQVPVNITFGQPQWANAVADRTAMLASQNISFAELQLDPPELGPLTVKIHINQDQAVVNFVAPSALIKDSLEQNNQRLKDMFNEQGLNLADVDVSERQSGDQETANNSDQDNTETAGHDELDVDGSTHPMTINHQISIDPGVDDFA